MPTKTVTNVASIRTHIHLKYHACTIVEEAINRNIKDFNEHSMNFRRTNRILLKKKSNSNTKEAETKLTPTRS